MRAIRSVLVAALTLAALEAWAAPPESPSWTVVGDRAYAHLGRTVSSAGDVNGDGYDEVVVGAPFYASDIGGGGKVYLYLGSSSGPSDQAAWSYQSSQSSSELGASVSSAGDLNGDGFDDLAVGAPRFDGAFVNSGRVFVFHGSQAGLPLTPSIVLDGPHPDANLGATLAVADVNGDGFDDLAAGVPLFKTGTVPEGRVFVYLGSGTGVPVSPSAILRSSSPAVQLGGTVAAAGDVNADGFADLVVNNVLVNPSSFNLYLGPMVSGGPDILPSQTIVASAAVVSFGQMTGAGDVDGDGFDDVLVGAAGFQGGPGLTGEGAVFVYPGSPAGLSVVPSWEAHGGGSGANLGFSVAPGGDIDGDGHRDLLVGAPNAENAPASYGRAAVYFGTGQHPALAPWWVAKGGYGTAFAAAVAGGGDINGDGRDDVVVGQDTFDGPYTDVGAVFAYFGSPLDGPDVQAGSDQVLECTGNKRAGASLSGSAGPGPIGAFEWFDLYGTPGQTLLGTGDAVAAPLLLGRHVLTLRATDAEGSPGFDDLLVDVRDTIPPALSAVPSRTMIWPPNHRTAPVLVSVQASDGCWLQTVSHFGVSSSEPDDAPGFTDGATGSDKEVGSGSPVQNFGFRAERDELGSGRTYHVGYRATDSVGLTTEVGFDVAVPHNVNGVTEPMMLRVEETAGGTVIRWSAVPGAINYNVIRGNVASLSEEFYYIELGAISCLAADLVATDTAATPDPAIPAVGEAFYYLADYDDGERVGYGEVSAVKPRRAVFPWPPADCP